MSLPSEQRSADGPSISEHWIGIGPRENDRSNEFELHREGDRVKLDWDKLAAADKHIQITNVTIVNDVILSKGRKLPLGIRFVDVTFQGAVNLSEVRVHGPLMFWNCKFESSADFSLMAVHPNEGEIEHSQPAELNFAYSFFRHKPTFERSEFDGRAHFHRTVFASGANFDSAIFKEQVNFEGFESDICVRTADLDRAILVWCSAMGQTEAERIPINFFSAMLKTGIIFINRDYGFDHFNFDPAYRSTKSLKRALEDLDLPAGLSFAVRKNVKEAICALWRDRFEQTMFSTRFLERTGGAEVYRNRVQNYPNEVENELLTSFRGTQFNRSVQFRHIDLAFCLFMGAKLENAKFSSSNWAKCSCNPILSRLPFLEAVFATRYCLRDELELERAPKPRGGKKGKHIKLIPKEEFAERRRDLSELYRELRLIYDDGGDSLVGRDFYFGELENERLSRSHWHRLVSATGAYKLLAGYSCQEGLALFWLLFIFVLSALCYSAIGSYEKSRIDLYPTVCNAMSPSSENPCSIQDAVENVWGVDGVEPSSKKNRMIVLMDRIAIPLSTSLQASTFLTPKPDSQAAARVADALERQRDLTMQRVGLNISVAESVKHVLEGSERVAILAQLGLLFLCLRSRFQRH